MLKTLITYGLSILVLSGGFHVHLHGVNPAAEPGVCKVDSDNEGSYNSIDQCEKCLTSSIKPTNPNNCDFEHNQNTQSLYSLNKSVKKSIFNYSLFGRPPPILI